MQKYLGLVVVFVLVFIEYTIKNTYLYIYMFNIIS